MAAVGMAQLLPDTPRGKVTTEDIGQRSYTLRYRVQTDSLTDMLNVVTNAPGVPRLFTQYVCGSDFDPLALARELSAERMGPASTAWIVTVEYRTFSKSELLTQYENPLLQLPDIETSMEKFQEPVFAVYDITKQELTPCRNSAGQVFDPPPMRDASRLILTITRNESISILHPAVDIAYQDTVNADVWWGCQPGIWKCQGVTSRREIKQLQSGTLFPYLRCTYKFEARPTWDLRILDAGSYYMDSQIGKKLFFTGDDGNPITGLLDGAGGKLAAGATPIFLTFRVYQRQPFTALNLPQSFVFGS